MASLTVPRALARLIRLQRAFLEYVPKTMSHHGALTRESSLVVFEVVPHVQLAEALADATPRPRVMEREVEHVVDEVAGEEAGRDCPGERRPEDTDEDATERRGERQRDAGGMTSRIGSFGWSWCTPWIIQWSRAPRPSFGSKWKTARWIQYSLSVQIP